MPATIRRSLKTWMLVYVGFALALMAADIGSTESSDVVDVSPGSIPGNIAVELSYFRPLVEQPSRNDI